MAQKESKANERSVPLTEARALDRIGRLLGLIATKDMPQKDQITLLRGTGFEVQEIADMLGTTANNVSVTLYKKKKQK